MNGCLVAGQGCVCITPQINWLTWMNRGGTGRVADG